MASPNAVFKPLVRDSIRQFNKWFYNPLMLTFAGRRVYAVVKHVGRRSGQPYATPVFAEETEDGFIIPLPYGETDWLRNVLAAGECTIRWRSVNYRVGHPVILDADEALPAFPLAARATLRLVGIKHYLSLSWLPYTLPQPCL